MFEATLDTSTFLRKTIEAVKEFVEDATLFIEQDSLYLQGLDKCKTMVVQLKLSDTVFDSPLRCDRPFSFRIAIKLLHSVLRKASPNDKLHLYCASDNPDTLQLTFINERASRYATFSLALQDAPGDKIIYKLDDPEDIHVRLNLPSSSLRRTLEQTIDFSSNVCVNAESNSVTFTASDVSGNSKICVSNRDEETSIVINEPVRMSFPLKRLLSITKAELTTSCSVTLRKGVPIVIRYQFDDEEGYLLCYLAPSFEGSDIED